MTDHPYPPRPRLSAAEQVKEIRRIAGLARGDASVVRCDGTAVALRVYRSGSSDEYWPIAADVEVDDLLLSTVKVGARRLVVSLCLVEAVTQHGVHWSDDNDVMITPAPELSDVLARTSTPTRIFKTRSAEQRDELINALCHLIAHPVSVPDREARASQERCSSWGRSRANREAKLHASDGRCECCGLDLRGNFGAQGDRGLEVHHRQALAKRPTDVVRTSLADLAVLCATCHRLVHTDKDLDIEVIRARWRLRE